MTGRIVRFAAAAAALSLAACRAGTSTLADFRPADRADEAAFGAGASQRDAGVEMTTAIGDWEGSPEDLRGKATPVRVAIKNDSDRPLRVQYGRFKLQSAAGKEYGALSPYDIRGTAEEITYVEPDFGHSGYQVYPHYSDEYNFGPDIEIWEGPFDYDAREQGGFGETETTELPSSDMLRKAIPEGVVQPGGEVSGHLFFEEIPAQVSRLTYEAELVDAETGERFGTILIPFERE